MPNQTKKVINLRGRNPESEEKRIKPQRPPENRKASDYYERILSDGDAEAGGKNWQTFETPHAGRSDRPFLRLAFFIGLVAIVALAAFWLFFHQKSAGSDAKKDEASWYAVKLTNGEVYYGRINDVKADPVVINSVYYNYDQLKNKDGDKLDESGNLRLVKRGKETHGPSGSMDIVRSQVVYMEPLKDDSKVLQAILDYEK